MYVGEETIGENIINIPPDENPSDALKIFIIKKRKQKINKLINGLR